MSDLIVIEKKNVLQVFTEPGAIDPILKQIETEALSLIPDVASAKGRKEIASVAYKVAQAKTYIDGIGKDLVADMKEIPKKVDASRKLARDFLDALKDKVRKPLDDWELDQERIEAEKKAAEEVAALARQVERDHEMGLLLNAEFDRQKEAHRIAAEQAKREHEERIAKEAAERAMREAEEKAKAEKEAAQRVLIEAELKARAAEQAAEAARLKAEAEIKAAAEREKQQAVEAERRRVEAEQKAEQDRKDAAARAEAEKERAIQAERERVAAQARAEAAEQAKREANKAHRAKINRAALAALVAGGIAEDCAMECLKLIVSGKVPAVQISY